ncbi:MAG: extracellular matrix regulatory protein [Halanaerobiales bacterium]|nr:extracellular matrix regulatory protein [Halanaerobiales bacterium]
MEGLMMIGFKNYIAKDKVVAITNYKSQPIKRRVLKARDEGMCIDCTEGRATKSVIFTNCGLIVLSSLTSDALLSRMEGGN